MLAFLQENWGTIVVGVLVFGIVVGVIVKLVRDARRGKHVGCGVGCGGCPSADVCHAPQTKTKKR